LKTRANRFEDDHAASRGTALPGEAERGTGQLARDFLDVAIRADHRRVVAPELRLNGLEKLRARAGRLPTRPARPGDRNRCDLPIGDHPLGRPRVPEDQAHGAGRARRLEQALHHERARARRLEGGLPDHGVPEDQRRRDLRHRNRHRIVPRRDQCDHAHGPAPRPYAFLAARHPGLLAAEETGDRVEHLHRPSHFGGSIRDGLADLERHLPGELRHAFAQDLGPPLEHQGAILARVARQVALGLRGTGRRGLHFAGARDGHPPQDLVPMGRVSPLP
jgi:hypothetical protein